MISAKKEYRDNGAVGALLDEYERAIEELKLVLSEVTSEELMTIVDPDTENSDCRSIQTILTHVVRAGYWYVIEIRRFMGDGLEHSDRVYYNDIPSYQKALDEMFSYNLKLFEDYPDLKIVEKDNQKKILVKWGQLYDVEQLFEHAIVHILRHRRQIERFLIKMRS